MQAGQAARVMGSIAQNIARVIVGKENQTELILASVLAGGHVLMEDVPGTGKTMLARALARSLDCKFARLQCTPDLMPADITGMSVYQPGTGEFVFKPGPVFTNVLLADEINRATPRTQSALLECMEERHVTEGGVTRALDAPFLVIATQNPIETQGTFPLPEAQLDRFLIRIKLGYPTAEQSADVLRRNFALAPVETLAPVATGNELSEAQREAEGCAVSDDIVRYIVSLCERTRAADNVQLGASTRGMLCLMRAARALAVLRGRDYVTPDDVKALAVPVLAHRVIVRGMYGRADAAEQVIKGVLEAVPAPTEASL